MASVQDELTRLTKEAEERRIEAERLGRLSAEFPDLQKHVGRWDKVAFYSKSVNSRVGRFDMRHNCGCCSDSPLELWPYLETPDGKVYSDPPCFQIGERSYFGGDKPYHNWKEKLKQAGIPEVIIESVGYYFDKCKEDRIRLASEDDEVPDDPEPVI